MLAGRSAPGTQAPAAACLRAGAGRRSTRGRDSRKQRRPYSWIGFRWRTVFQYSATPAIHPSPRRRRCRHGDAAHFHELVEGNRGRPPPARAQRGEERPDALLLTLVLAPQIHPPEPRPAESRQPPEIVELQDAPRGEHLEALLRERAVAVRQV